MVINKRPADIQDRRIEAEAFKLSKSDWTDLYFDLYRQCFGETIEEREIMDDAKVRLEILKYNRNRTQDQIAYDNMPECFPLPGGGYTSRM